MIAGPVVSSRKVNLISDYLYFDLMPIKKLHECHLRIPETVMLERGYIKSWVFNSHCIPNHPILKKKRENMTPLAVVKTFCHIFGYGKYISGLNDIKTIKQEIKIALKQQKDYDFVKDKKVIDIITVSNETLSMSLFDFLSFVTQNKYLEQQFYEKWKIIQQKSSHAKIDEFYYVHNVRHNHVIESKCQKIISVNTTQAHVTSTELTDDPYRQNCPGNNFPVAETKNLEGYKFFDTFLNKKFFQMSSDLIEFIEKNLKCVVESVRTKFVINKDREPYMVGVYDLQLKPAKAIVEMQQYKALSNKAVIRVEQYTNILEKYLSQNLDKQGNWDMHTPLSHQRKRCKGKFCQLPFSDLEMPALLQQKLKLPYLSANTRMVGLNLREAVLKRRKKVIEKLIDNGIIEMGYQFVEESSEYEYSADNEDISNVKTSTKQLRICKNCFVFYFHVGRFYELDSYGNLIERKAGARTNQIETILPPINTSHRLHQNRVAKKLSIYEQQGLDASIITNNRNQPVVRSQSNRKFEAPALQSSLQTSNANKSHKHIKSDRKIQNVSVTKIKMDSLGQSKKLNNQDQMTVDKINRLANLTRLSQPQKLKEPAQLSSKKNMPAQKPRRPENQEQAVEQIVKKLSGLPYSSRDQFIYFAKNYHRDNKPQPIDCRQFSSYYHPHLYEFMNNTPITVHPKQRIKKRPEMSLKRLSELTDYPEIVSRSEFIFDTLIVNEQTTVPFCVMTTKVVNPDNLRKNKPYENIFIVNDLFDCFIEYISLAKQILEEEGLHNKRIVLFNYPGQSHTIYCRTNVEGYSASFSEVMDKLLYRFSELPGELNIVNLQKDLFKFFGFGFGGYLLANYISYAHNYLHNISGVALINSFLWMPKKYESILMDLKELYQTADTDPTVTIQSYLYYNKAIDSQQISREDLEHKAGLNAIRVEDRFYLLEAALKQQQQTKTTCEWPSSRSQPLYFEDFDQCRISIIYGKNNTLISKDQAMQFLTYRKNDKQSIPNRVFIQLDAGHDIMADNYEDIARVIIMASKV